MSIDNPTSIEPHMLLVTPYALEMDICENEDLAEGFMHPTAPNEKQFQVSSLAVYSMPLRWESAKSRRIYPSQRESGGGYAGDNNDHASCLANTPLSARFPGTLYH